MTKQPASRQQRRRRHRQLIEEGERALARGLPDPLPDEVALGFGLLLVDKLSEAGNPRRAGEAAALAETLLDRTLAPIEKATPDIACRRGCDHCCVTVASVTPPEIFRVATWLRAQRAHSPSLSPAVVAARCTLKQGASLEAMLRQKVPCPALVDRECGVHGVRPLNCRQFFSRSLAACIDRFERDVGDIPFVGPAVDKGLLIRCLMLAAFRAAGLPDASYELSGALAAALADPNAEARWLAGDLVFASALPTPRPASTQESIDSWSRLIAEAAGLPG